MLFDKQQIVSMITDAKQQKQANQQLPDQVDHEQHAGLLQKFGIDPDQLAAQGGGQGQGGFNDPSQGSYGQGFDDPNQGDTGYQ